MTTTFSLAVVQHPTAAAPRLGASFPTVERQPHASVLTPTPLLGIRIVRAVTMRAKTSSTVKEEMHQLTSPRSVTDKIAAACRWTPQVVTNN